MIGKKLNLQEKLAKSKLCRVMLNAWNNEYHHRNNHLELRLKKLAIKLNRWWIYYRYSGNPNKDPYILTSRPKNIPLISLRTEEYGGLLSNKEFVGQKWEEFWRAPEADLYNVNFQQKSFVPNTKKTKRLPLRELNINEIPQKIHSPNRNMPKFKIYHDENIAQKEKPVLPKNKIALSKKKTLKTLKSKKSKRNMRKPLQVVYQQELDDNGSLDSFERELIESSNQSLSGTRMLLPFGENKQELRELVTPVYSDYESERDELARQEEEKKETLTFLNFDSVAPNPQLNVVQSAGVNEIDLDRDFGSESFYPKSLIRKVIAKKPNYYALGLDGDQIATQNQIKYSGMKGWISNKVRPETRSTFDNRLTLNSYPVRNQVQQRLPLIQRPEFFDRNQLQSKESRFNNKNTSYINEYREYQVKNYVRSTKVRREKRKESRKRPLSRKRNDTEKERAITVLKRIKDNTKEKLWDTLVSVPGIQNNESAKDLIENIEKRNKKHSLRSGFHNWRLFNGHRYTRDVPSLHHVEDANPEQEKHSKVATLRQISNYEAMKIPKAVTIVSPSEGNVQDKENWPENYITDYVDEYDIIADYEDLSD